VAVAIEALFRHDRHIYEDAVIQKRNVADTTAFSRMLSTLFVFNDEHAGCSFTASRKQRNSQEVMYSGDMWHIVLCH